MSEKRCYNCKFLCHRDSGYSNYTVMETYMSCLYDKFEETEESYSYGSESGGTEDHEFWKQAEACPHFKDGNGAHFDVDGDTTIEDYKDDPELYQRLKEKQF